MRHQAEELAARGVGVEGNIGKQLVLVVGRESRLLEMAHIDILGCSLVAARGEVDLWIIGGPGPARRFGTVRIHHDAVETEEVDGR